MGGRRRGRDAMRMPCVCACAAVGGPPGFRAHQRAPRAIPLAPARFPAGRLPHRGAGRVVDAAAVGGVAGHDEGALQLRVGHHVHARQLPRLLQGYEVEVWMSKLHTRLEERWRRAGTGMAQEGRRRCCTTYCALSVWCPVYCQRQVTHQPPTSPGGLTGRETMK